MTVVVRQSTAFETAIGPVLDADGVAVTDCVVGDFKLKKTSGNFAALNGSATLTHVSAGTYDLVLTTSDTDTVGVCCVSIDDTTNTCAPLRMQVIEEAVFDELYAASATGFTALLGALNTAAATGDPGTTVTLIAYLKQLINILIGTSGVATFPSSAAPGNGVSLAEVLRAIYDDTDVIGTPSNLGGGATVAANLSDIEAQTDDIGVAGAGLTALATAAQINGLAVNTRANLNVPVEIETPDASTQTYKIRLHLFDVEGNMEAPDSTPTIALTNAAGTDRSSRLSSASNPSTGVYTWDYTATAGDTEEQLVWVFTVVEGGATRTYPATSYVVEESAYRFSSTDRANLNAVLADTAELQTDWANGGRLDLILDARASQTSVDDVPTNSELATALGTADDAVLAQVALVKAKTDLIPASPAAVGDIPTAAGNADAVWDEAKSGHVSAGSFGLALADVYHADIQFTRDETNEQDEYTITWFRNGARVTSGITVPTIQVVKRADGSDLIASTTPTQIASTGTYKHDATTTARQTEGEAVLVVVGATIDGSARSFSRLIGRDSS